jgi:hypothetical protein
MTDDDQLLLWEQQEEQREFAEACHVANRNLWLCDDGAP